MDGGDRGARDLFRARFRLARGTQQMRSIQEAIKRRDVLAKRMTPPQIAEAQKLVREWKR